MWPQVVLALLCVVVGVGVDGVGVVGRERRERGASSLLMVVVWERVMSWQ